MSTKQRQVLTIEDSNLADATKKEYGYRLKQFFHDSTIKSYEELIDTPSEELENTLAGSAVVPIFIAVTNTIPWNTLGYIPSDFKIALEILGKKTE